MKAQCLWLDEKPSSEEVHSCWMMPIPIGEGSSQHAPGAQDQEGKVLGAQDIQVLVDDTLHP